MCISVGSSASNSTPIGLAVGFTIGRRCHRCENVCRFQGPVICEVSTNDLSRFIGIHFRRVFVVVQFIVVIFQSVMYASISCPLNGLNQSTREIGFGIWLGVSCKFPAFFILNDTH
jgi:hypothetical protein